jgi:hypothetical protein
MNGSLSAISVALAVTEWSIVENKRTFEKDYPKGGDTSTSQAITPMSLRSRTTINSHMSESIHAGTFAFLELIAVAATIRCASEMNFSFFRIFLM